MSGHVTAPFGSYPLTPLQNWARTRGHKLKPGWLGKRMGSLYRRVAGARNGRPFDVELFGTQRARLHPYDNSCERRVFCTPQFWEHDERRVLAEYMQSAGNDVFSFIDVGANVGLYSLYVRAVAQRSGISSRICAVEPEPVVRERLEFNLAASGASDICVLPWAAVGKEGTVQLSVDENNRGENCIDGQATDHSAIAVEGRKLIAIFDAAGIDQPDAMKIDVEGAEYPAIRALLDSAPRHRWPKLILVETFHEDPAYPVANLCSKAGYRIRLKTKLNVILTL
ncbi:MAG: FkbM family methyltransferase [Gammaproteobacteria bacterium]|nr:MAG: FkbM family methyltransferase [Gammaproteobacteria bacterium]